jgi:hypothetical protein
VIDDKHHALPRFRASQGEQRAAQPAALAQAGPGRAATVGPHTGPGLERLEDHPDKIADVRSPVICRPSCPDEVAPGGANQDVRVLKKTMTKTLSKMGLSRQARARLTLLGLLGLLGSSQPSGTRAQLDSTRLSVYLISCLRVYLFFYLVIFLFILL